MIWNCPNLDNDDDLRIVHDALVLKWARVVESLKATNDKDLTRSYARDIIRTVDLLQSMEELDF